jgi:hypothetical protein
MAAFFAELVDSGASGLHLLMSDKNWHAGSFYARVGFRRLSVGARWRYQWCRVPRQEIGVSCSLGRREEGNLAQPSIYGLS